MIYDLIIIGAGPAGMTAGIYAARRKLKFIIISMDVGGQMSWSSEVDNYPGVPDQTGIALVERFNHHMQDYNIKIRPEEVSKLEKKKNLCIITTRKKTYQSKAVIIASGKSPKKLDVPGEENLIGKGVSYCATCDSPLYRDKVVAVVGAGNSGLEAALFLSKYAKKVYIMDMMPQLGGELYLKDKVLADRRIKFIPNAEIKGIFGKKSVSSLLYEKDGKEKKLEVEGVFVEIGLVTKADFAKVKKNKWGEIKIYRSTKTNEENLTSKRGIFAAGDVTDIPAKQIIVAAGEGSKACLAAIDYIQKWKG